MLTELRLPSIARLWPEFTRRADEEGWPAARLLAALAEIELADRARRRIERHLAEARLPAGKTLASFDFTAVPMLSKAHVTALAACCGWIDKGANLLAFGPPGSGKSHAAAAIGHALVETGYRVLFTRTTDLVQRLQVARRALNLEAAIAKLDKYHLLILDDFCYARKDQAETGVLFELIAARYERRSLLVTANKPFGAAAARLLRAVPSEMDRSSADDRWNEVFPDPAMTVAAVDRLVHHATILELNVESYRRRTALSRPRQQPRRDGDTEREVRDTAHS
ncbi:MAG: hypothetical protein EA356_05845 [Geminicoccaceae bacterium]|nr:MAG: hypothetical protein EA356_05845 [Geminicoccaceae bacterium]